jgi:bacteriorhodopsin
MLQVFMVAKCIGVLYFRLMICFLSFPQEPGNQIPIIDSANPVMSLVSYCALYSNLDIKMSETFTAVIIFAILLYGH